VDDPPAATCSGPCSIGSAGRRGRGLVASVRRRIGDRRQRSRETPPLPPTITAPSRACRSSKPIRPAPSSQSSTRRTPVRRHRQRALLGDQTWMRFGVAGRYCLLSRARRRRGLARDQGHPHAGSATACDTQSASQSVSQQKTSTAQTLAAHAGFSQPGWTKARAVQHGPCPGVAVGVGVGVMVAWTPHWH
jgi:hypothetical protein